MQNNSKELKPEKLSISNPKSTHYVDNSKFLEELVKYKKKVTEAKDKLLTSKSPLNFKLEPVMFPLADTLPFILKVSVTSFVLIPI